VGDASYLIGVFNAEVSVVAAEGGAGFNRHGITAVLATRETAIGDVVCVAALVDEVCDSGWLADWRGVGVLEERKTIASALENLRQLGRRQCKGWPYTVFAEITWARRSAVAVGGLLATGDG